MPANKDAAMKVLNEIRNRGFEAMFAGGCVRDMLLNREPKDYDIVTNAIPEEVVQIFRRTIEVGAQFGVVMVMVGDEQIEVATFRTEDGYLDGRRPSSVEFTDAKEDALRRDFTVNGMFYDPVSDEVVDFVEGKKDLPEKLIRAIGQADVRFSEDYLRMLRAVRFAAELEFEIEPDTWQAVKDNSHKITGISGERIAMELEKLFACNARSRGVRLLVDSGLATYIFPEISSQNFEHGIKVLDAIIGPVTLELGMSALFSSCAPKLAVDQSGVMKLSRPQLKFIDWSLNNRSLLLDSDMRLAILRKFLADERFAPLLRLQRAVQISTGQSLEPLDSLVERISSLEGIEMLPEPLLDGHAIMKLGIKPGPLLGKIANELYDLQLDEIINCQKDAEQFVLSRVGDQA